MLNLSTILSFQRIYLHSLQHLDQNLDALSWAKQRNTSTATLFFSLEVIAALISVQNYSKFCSPKLDVKNFSNRMKSWNQCSESYDGIVHKRLEQCTFRQLIAFQFHKSLHLFAYYFARACLGLKTIFICYASMKVVRSDINVFETYFVYFPKLNIFLRWAVF